MANYLDSNGLTHLWSNLKTLLAGKANSSHTHTIADVNNLQTTLDGITESIPDVEALSNTDIDNAITAAG